MSEKGGTELKFVDCGAQLDSPKYRGKVGNRIDSDGNSTTSAFSGFKTGLSADVTFLKLKSEVSDNASMTGSGPSIGGDIGLFLGSENKIVAMVEPSLCKVEGQIGPFVGSLGYNLTTGVKLSEEGFKFAWAGFGLTMGIGGKFSVDTPFGSGGVGQKLTQTRSNTQTITMKGYSLLLPFNFGWF
ncbi:hypothetical protein Ocin01_15798 [Orchesella cincta]|uniref:Uncharacterized protein n=1 Tax=Orchesella cincta TaxID=48709 RepID=A0A1D2MD48_ORCCI|nr:hypothetical protein Ocin01_15798 [Orchesella cincta]